MAASSYTAFAYELRHPRTVAGEGEQRAAVAVRRWTATGDGCDVAVTAADTLARLDREADNHEVPFEPLTLARRALADIATTDATAALPRFSAIRPPGQRECEPEWKVGDWRGLK